MPSQTSGRHRGYRRIAADDQRSEYTAKEGRDTFRFNFRELGAISNRDELRRKQTVQRVAQLTEREREIMDVLVEGNSNKAIAYLLGASPRTIESSRA